MYVKEFVGCTIKIMKKLNLPWLNKTSDGIVILISILPISLLSSCVCASTEKLRKRFEGFCCKSRMQQDLEIKGYSKILWYSIKRPFPKFKFSPQEFTRGKSKHFRYNILNWGCAYHSSFLFPRCFKLRQMSSVCFPTMKTQIQFKFQPIIL